MPERKTIKPDPISAGETSLTVNGLDADPTQKELELIELDQDNTGR